MSRLAVRLALVACVVVALSCSGCASTLRVDNPNLHAEGQIAVRGVQLVSVIRTAQLAIEPLIDARVISAQEGLAVAEGLGVVLTSCQTLVALLQTADAARDAVERVQALRGATGQMRAALQTLTTLPGRVNGDAGKMAISASAGKVVHALGDMMPAFGGVQ